VFSYVPVSVRFREQVFAAGTALTVPLLLLLAAATCSFCWILPTITPTLNPTVMTAAESSWGGIISHTQHSAGDLTDERYTPEWILDLATSVMGAIDLDPCADPLKRVPAANHYTKTDNGLERSWSGRIFLNPPFSKVPIWIKTLSLFIASGSVSEAIVLLPITSIVNKSSRLLMRQQAEAFALFERNIQFLDETYKEMPPNTFIPSVLIYAGNNYFKFAKAIGKTGVLCLLASQDDRSHTVSCTYCGKFFQAQRSTAKFCGTTCRVEAHRKKV